VGDADGRVRRVDRLPSRAGGAEHVDLQIVVIDMDLDVCDLGEHRVAIEVAPGL
jgi:hypothetical protein